MDANAVSPLWFSKIRYISRESEERGCLLEECLIGMDMNVLNEPSELYTFSGARGESDIDVTVVTKECERYEFEWCIKNEWSMSDHNAILVYLKYDVRCETERVVKNRWLMKNVDWDEYMRATEAE